MLAEKDIFKALKNGKVALPPLIVSLIEHEPKLRAFANDSYRPDALVVVANGRRRWKFLAELKAVATAKAFENACAAIKPASAKVKLNPMIVLPYLSPENLAELESTGVSGIDLCGNGIIAVPGELLVLRTGQPNRFPRTEPIRNVYRGDSSLVGRVFLSQPIYNAVGEIVSAVKRRGSNISFPTVSKVLKTFEADLIIERSRDKTKLLQADKLLDQLVANYRPPKVTERYVGKVALGERELPLALTEAASRLGAKFTLAGTTSAGRYSVLAREPVVAAYSDVSPNDLLSALGVKFEETNRFPNIDLMSTDDSLPYFEPATDAGVIYASPVQTYLELMAGDKRLRETADQVREFVLNRVREYRENP
jgi:hypothetical protein